MAFDVTPTSGAGPYTFSAVISDPANIDGIRYSLEFYNAAATGSCPSPLSGSMNAQAATDILNNGFWIRPQTVPSGDCRASMLLVRDLLTNTVISSVTINIDNIA